MLPSAPTPAHDASFQRVVDTLHDHAIFTIDPDGLVFRPRPHAAPAHGAPHPFARPHAAERQPLGLQALQGKPIEQLPGRAARTVALALDADHAIVLAHLDADDDFVVRGRYTVAGYLVESQDVLLIDDFQ